MRFEMGVGVEQIVNINRRKLNILVDENGEATPTASRSITTQKRITGERRIRITRTKLRLLYAGNLDIVFSKERSEFALRCI